LDFLRGQEIFFRNINKERFEEPVGKGELSVHLERLTVERFRETSRSKCGHNHRVYLGGLTCGQGNKTARRRERRKEEGGGEIVAFLKQRETWM